MIEILNKSDVDKINDEKLKQYLIKSLNELPEDFDYPNDGYFVIIENQNEIKSTPITLSTCQLNSLDTGLYDDINMLEDMLDEEIKEKLQEYVI